MLVGAVLVPVEHLINGVSVLWNDAERVVEYYHVELDAHDVMLANGAQGKIRNPSFMASIPTPASRRRGRRRR